MAMTISSAVDGYRGVGNEADKVTNEGTLVVLDEDTDGGSRSCITKEISSNLL